MNTEDNNLLTDIEFTRRAANTREYDKLSAQIKHLHVWRFWYPALRKLDSWPQPGAELPNIDRVYRQEDLLQAWGGSLLQAQRHRPTGQEHWQMFKRSCEWFTAPIANTFYQLFPAKYDDNDDYWY